MNRKLDGLQIGRGIAALLVVLFHVTQSMINRFNYPFLGNFFEFGFSGVDFFFVLSGFIILYTNQQSFNKPAYCTTYLTRRFIRIIPIYWIIVIAKLSLLIVLPSLSTAQKISVNSILASFLLYPIQNAERYLILGVAWSLSYELWFYLLFGLGIFIGKKKYFQILILWSIVIFAWTIASWLGVIPISVSYIWKFFFNERNLGFSLGCLAAWLILQPNAKSREGFFAWFPYFSLTVGVMWFVFSAYIIWLSGVVNISYFLLFDLPSFLVVTGISLLETQHPDIKSSIPTIKMVKKGLVLQGDASYSIYLTHIIFIDAVYFTLKFTGLLTVIPPMIIGFLMIGSSLVGGISTFLLVEKPIISCISKLMYKKGWLPFHAAKVTTH